LHEAYYRFWHRKGKLHKAYVRRADLERVKAGCEKWAEMDRAAIGMVNSADGQKVRLEIRQMMRSAGAPENIIRRMTRKKKRYRAR
jgi:hypothetical protein